ncbi:MAG TPA: hypothetical protein VF662_00580 [Allosphingosinicella sp.]
MNVVLAAHIAGGSIALVSGAAAIAARKGGAVHGRAGNWFFAAMLVLGVTALVLALLGEGSAMGFGGLLTGYFVVTSWVAARRRDGVTGRFEIAACLVALGGAAAIIWFAANGASTPVGPAPLFVFAGICLLAGLLDLNAILRTRLTPVQRISRHLWRMCFAFFIATGSFFLGQQDVMPNMLRRSPILFVPAFAPLAVLAFWLVRLRWAKWYPGERKKGPVPEDRPWKF